MSARWRVLVTKNAGRADRPTDPVWNDSDVPLCDDRCPYHDGKRCELLGRRPGDACEPVVAQMAKSLGDVMS